MSYLMIDDENNSPEFKKAIISFWFKVSQETVDTVYKEAKLYYAEAKAANDAGGFLPPPPFTGVIPLVVFGKQETQNGLGSHFKPNGRTTFHVQVFAFGAFCRWIYFGDNFADASLFQWNHERKYDYQVDPSYVGIDCKPTLDDDGDPTGPPKVRLALNLQMEDSGKYIGGSWVNQVSVDNQEFTNWNVDPNFQDAVCAGPGPPPYSSASNIITVEGVPELVYGARPENFRILPESPSSLEGGKEITPDEWHHVLIAFNLTECKVDGYFVEAPSLPPLPDGETEYHGSVSKAAKLWIAVDDENLTKKDLSVYWPKSGGDNDFISVNAYGVYTDIAISAPPVTFIGGGHEEITQGTVGVKRAVYSYDPPNVLANPFGIPAFEEFEDNIRLCEMAEFLMFTDFFGDKFDLGIEENRRHFISGPDKEGFQHPVNASPLYIPMRKFAFGDPTTWEPGADNPAFVPPLLDPSAWPTAIKINGEVTTAAIDFTKCQFNWMMGRNLGTVKSTVAKVGGIKAYSPDPKVETAE